MKQSKVIRIGGASGFWGDSSVGAIQLVRSGQIDYLVFDYLAELTMSILASARLKKPELGYATDFVTVAMKSVLKDVVRKGIRVVSNAGGVNPQGCADALRVLAADLGVDVKIAVVTGDDVMPLLPQLRAAQPPVGELQSGAPLPAKVLTANAYLGAAPVAAALAAGSSHMARWLAQIVWQCITAIARVCAGRYGGVRPAQGGRRAAARACAGASPTHSHKG